MYDDKIEFLPRDHTYPPTNLPSCDKPPPSSLDDGDEVCLALQDAFPQFADVHLDNQTRRIVACPLEQLTPASKVGGGGNGGL